VILVLNIFFEKEIMILRMMERGAAVCVMT